MVWWYHFSQVIRLHERPFQRPCSKKTACGAFSLKKALQAFTVPSIWGHGLLLIDEKDDGMAECLDLWEYDYSESSQGGLTVPSTPHWEAPLTNWVASQTTCSSLKIKPRNVFSCPFETPDHPLKNSALCFPKKSLTFSRLCIFI